jgi:hypothetical protein
VIEAKPMQADDQGRAESDLFKRVRENQRARKVTRLIVITLLGLTLYAFLLNLYLIVRAKTGPLTVRLYCTADGETNDQFAPNLSWLRLPELDPGQVPPTVLWEGRPVPREDEEERFEVPLGDYEVFIDIRRNTPPGRYEGRIHVDHVSGSLLDQQLTIPVSVSITGNLWRQWFFVRDWLLVAGAGYLLIYLICLLFLERIHVLLTFTTRPPPESSTVKETATVYVKPPLSALLLPWRASTANWRRLIPEGAPTVLKRLTGSLESMDSMVVLHLHAPSGFARGLSLPSDTFDYKWVREGHSVILLDPGEVCVFPLEEGKVRTEMRFQTFNPRRPYRFLVVWVVLVILYFWFIFVAYIGGGGG